MLRKADFRTFLLAKSVHMFGLLFILFDVLVYNVDSFFSKKKKGKMLRYALVCDMPSFACSLISKLTQCIKRSCFHVSDRAVETKGKIMICLPTCKRSFN